jgi:hypothetical protein
MQAHHLRPESWQLVMRDNAMRMFPKMTARMKL